MGNKLDLKVGKLAISCLSSFALAFSLFAMPAMAAQPSTEQRTEDSAINFKHPANGASALEKESEDASVSKLGHDADANTNADASGTASSRSSEQEGQGESVSESENAQGADGGESQEPSEGASAADDSNQESADQDSQESVSPIDAILGFFASINPFSSSPDTIDTAAVEVTLQTLSPSAVDYVIAQEKKDITLTLTGKNSEGTHTAKFEVVNADASHFITNANGSSVDVAQRPKNYVAYISDLPPGTYTAKIEGPKYVTYTQSNITVGAGDKATFSLIDNTIHTSAGSIPSSMSTLGLIPFGNFDDSDLTINNADAKQMVEDMNQIADGVFGAGHIHHDITGTGTIDIRDLHMLSMNVGKVQPATSVNKSMDISKMEFTPGEFTKATHSSAAEGAEALHRLSVDDGTTTTLKLNDTAAVGEIAKDFPVGFSVNTKNVNVKGAVLQARRYDDGTYPTMPTSGIVSMIIPDPDAEGEKKQVDFYVNLANADVPAMASLRSSLKDQFENDGFKEKTTFTYDQSTGQVTLEFPYAVNLEKLEFKFYSTAAPDTESVELTSLKFFRKSKSEVPAPKQLSTPQLRGAQASDQEITLDWEPVEDALTYDVQLGTDDAADVYTTSATSISITDFDPTGTLQNGTTYQAKVRANGLNIQDGSGWSESISATPEYTDAPDSATNLRAFAGFSEITLEWDASQYATGYVLNYKESGSDDVRSQQVSGTRTTINGLSNGKIYEFSVIAQNAYGDSAPSDWISVQTTAAAGKIPWFNLINRTSQDAGAHPASEAISAASDLAAIDGDFNTFVDLGSSGDKELVMQLSGTHNIRYLALTTSMGEGFDKAISDVYVSVSGKNTHGMEYDSGVLSSESGITWRTIPTQGGVDDIAENTIWITLPQTFVNVDRLNVGFVRSNGEPATISEIALYEADGFQEDINDLWTSADRSHLRDGLTEQDLDELASRIQATDPASAQGEHAAETHPLMNDFMADIQAARDILAGDGKIFTVNTNISAQGSDAGPAGTMSAWQPLGVSAKAGSTIKVYVGTPDGTQGQPSKLRLIATQFGASEDEYFASLGNLCTGMNEITIPTIGEDGAERGGALYVEYTSSDPSEQYSLNVMGATTIPVLDLSTETMQAEGADRATYIANYLSNLEQHVGNLSDAHSAASHAGTGWFGMFSDHDCTANITEIVTPNMTISIPATQLAASLGGGSTADKAYKLDRALAALEQEATLVHQHSGFFDVSSNPNTAGAFGQNNQTPASRHSFRYIADADSAQAEAGSLTWDMCAALTNIDSEDTADARATFYASAQARLASQMATDAFGSSMALQGYYETLLASVDPEKDSPVGWNKVLTRVTSGIEGSLTDELQSAMYWQLHLAYDKAPANTAYDDAYAQMSSILMARINAYSRNPQCAPYGLNLGDNADQNLIRLISAAAERNLADYFAAWGLKANDETLTYLQNFAKEQRQLQYMHDSLAISRSGLNPDAKQLIPVQPKARIDGFDEASQQVIVRVTDRSVGSLGTEIYRQVEGQSPRFVSFVDANTDTFADAVQNLPECEVAYAVRSIDQTLIPSLIYQAGSTKVTHPKADEDHAYATLSKAKVHAVSNFANSGNTADSALAAIAGFGDSSKDASIVVNDNLNDSVEGKPASGNASAMLALGSTEDVYGIRYYPGIEQKSFRGMRVETSVDGIVWQEAANRMLRLPSDASFKGYSAYDGKSYVDLIFEEDIAADEVSLTGQGALSPKKAAYIRITDSINHTDTVSISEIDILGRPLDTVSFLDEDQNFGIGLLSDDLTIESAFEGVDPITVPKGSFVVAGRYTGNPDHIVVALEDQNGNPIASTKDQILLTNRISRGDEAKSEASSSVYDGIWLYYFNLDNNGDIMQVEQITPKLYRTGNPAELTEAVLMSCGSAVTVPHDAQAESIEAGLLSVNLDLSGYVSTR